LIALIINALPSGSGNRC